MRHCEFCQDGLLEGEGLTIDIFIGPARAAELEVRYGQPFPLDAVRVMSACEFHRAHLVPHLISLGFVG
jgi:hypothetical protein